MNSESLFGPTAESLWKKKRKKRTSLTSSSNLPPNIAAELGNAEMLYVSGDVQQAIELLSNVSRQAPRLAEPYNILGLIYEESGDHIKALQLYALAASFSTNSTKKLDLWKKIAKLADQIGEYEQGIAACIRCYKFEPSHEHLGRRIILLVRSHQMKKARELLRDFFEKYPDELGFLIDYADEVEKIGVSDVALSSYLKFVFLWLGTNCTRNELLLSFVRVEYERKSLSEINAHLDDIFYAVRKTVDILLHKSDGLLPAIDLIDICVDCHQAITSQMPFDATGAPSFPLDLSLLMGICKLKQREEQSVEIGVSILNPILKKLEESDLDYEGNTLVPGALGWTESIHGHSSSAGYDTSDSEGEDDTTQGGGISNSSSRHNDLATIVTTAVSDLSLFIARQRIRVAEEFAGLGMLTRADKLLSQLSSHLRNVGSLLIKLENQQEESGVQLADGAVSLSNDENLMKSLGSMWRDIGNVYLLLEKTEHAYAAYTTSLDLFAADIEVLSRYAELTRLYFPDNSDQVFSQLSDHFNTLIQEYEAALAYDPNADSHPMSKRSSTKSLASSGGGGGGGSGAVGDSHVQKTVRFQDTSGGTGSEHAGVPMDVSGNASQAALTVHSGGDDDAGADNDMYHPLDVTLGEDMDAMDDEDEDDRRARKSNGPVDSSAGRSEVTAANDGEEAQGDDDDEEGEEEQEGEGVSLRPGRGVKRERFFSRSALQHELFALIEWCHLLIASEDADNLLVFCSVSVPLLEHWCFSSTYAAGVLEGQHHKHRRRHNRQVVSIHDLVNTNSAEAYHTKDWLSSTQNNCGRFINGLCDYVNAERLVTKDVLMDLAKKTAPILTQIGSTLDSLDSASSSDLSTPTGVLSELAGELLHACTLMHMRRSSAKKRNRVSAAELYEDITTQQQQQNQQQQPEEEFDTDTSDSEDDVEGESEGAAAAASSDVGRRMKLSTRKRKLSSVQSRVRRRRFARVRLTGVNGGLMFNDFKAAASMRREDPFLAAVASFSQAVKDAAKQLLANPDDMMTANVLFRRIISESSMFETPVASKYVDNIFPVHRLFTVNPHCAVSALLSGYDHVKNRKNQDAFRKFLNAFCLSPRQPLVVLCLASFMVTLSNHSHVKHRQDVLMKGLYFMQRYGDLRKAQVTVPDEHQRGECVSQVALEQETHYNLGRALHDIQLFHLAVDQYNLALALADQHPDLLMEKSLHVTREAAHNLVLIYKRSECLDLALEVMTKYLSFD